MSHNYSSFVYVVVISSAKDRARTLGPGEGVSTTESEGTVEEEHD